MSSNNTYNNTVYGSSPSSSTSDLESIFSVPTHTCNTPVNDDTAFNSYSSAEKEFLLKRLIGSMDPSTIAMVEKTAQEAREKFRDVLPEVYCMEKARVSTEFGQAFLYRYRTNCDDKEHLAWVYKGAPKSNSLQVPFPNETPDEHIIRGNYSGTLINHNYVDSVHNDEKIHTVDNKDPLVRLHSECFTGDIMGSTRCDCGEQLKEAKRLAAEQGGIILYLRQEGRGIGLGEKMKAYNLQDLGADTVVANQLLGHPAENRNFGIATAILLDLNQSKIRLLTNNPAKIETIQGKNNEVEVTERVSMIPLSWQNDPRGIYSKELDVYLNTKQNSMGHLLV